MYCTIYKTADIIGKRWTLLILLQLYKGSKRYSEIKANIKNITPKMLSARLKELEKEQIILKHINTSTTPIRCTYSLSESGKDLIKVIKDLKKWSLKWKIINKICENSDCKNCSL